MQILCTPRGRGTAPRAHREKLVLERDVYARSPGELETTAPGAERNSAALRPGKDNVFFVVRGSSGGQETPKYYNKIQKT